METPPVLTAERIDAMLSIMAEVCLESVVDAGRFQKAAEDAEAFERSGRALQRACRNLRQTIALKQRFDRDQAHRADEGRKLAQAQRAEAERARRHRVEQMKAGVERHFERVLWDEYEPDEAQELFEEVAMRVKDAGFEDGFLETPVEALIERFADEIGIGKATTSLPYPSRGGVGGGGADGEVGVSPPPPAPPRRGEGSSVTVSGVPPDPSPMPQGEASSTAKPHSTAEHAEVCAEGAETPRLRVLSEPSASSAVESNACGAHHDPPAAPPEPPPRPPDPEPYGERPPLPL